MTGHSSLRALAALLRVLTDRLFFCAQLRCFLLPLGLLVLAVEYVRMLRVYFGHRQDWREKRTYVRLMLIFAWLVPVWTVLRNLLGL